MSRIFPRTIGGALAALTLLLCTTLTNAQGTLESEAITAAEKPGNTAVIVILHTNKGKMTLELYPDKAPVTVANFLAYAKSGFYNGTIFHRVMSNFMIQGGGMTKDMVEKPTGPAIVNESNNGLHNDRWSVAMARTDEPDSATSQFFINTRFNPRLDRIGGKPGYAVFGKLIEGMYVARAIGNSKTHRRAGHQNVPLEPVIIERIEIP